MTDGERLAREQAIGECLDVVNNYMRNVAPTLECYKAGAVIAKMMLAKVVEPRVERASSNPNCDCAVCHPREGI